MSFSTRHIDYLTRAFLEELGQDPVDFQSRIPDPNTIRLLRVSVIPRIWEKHYEMVGSSRQLMQDVIAGLRGMMMPIVYLVLGEGNQVSVFLGTFSQSTSTDAEESLKMVRSILTSAYPGIEFDRDGESLAKSFKLEDLSPRLSQLKCTAIVTGTPTRKVGTEEVGVEQIERVIRGLYGNQWAYLVVASPILTSEVTRVYNEVLAETKAMTDAEAGSKTRNPLAARYKRLLTRYLKKLEDAKTQGAWETCSYILCQEEKLLRQAQGIVESVFGGSKSVPDHIKTIRADRASRIAQSMGSIITPAPRGPGLVQYRLKYMNILSSADLSSMVHLPTSEMPGYFVKTYSRFDVFPHRSYQKEAVLVGEVLDEGRPMGCQYKVGLGDLSKHCLVVGTTGSGKTNTVFHLIRQLWQMKPSIPFLVIEPAKTEYRKLLASAELGSELQVFTLGDENTSPFRLNPFELLPGVPLQTHIDHLKSVFGASFVMWAPMPHVLERAIHEIYQDKGWNLVENTNPRGTSSNAFPTLTDLYLKIDEVVSRLGYEEKVTMDVKAALKTRIDSLRIGGKGLMLDVRKGIPFSRLLSKPTILELEAVSDDDEKALLIGIILVFLQEHYASKGLTEGAGLQHVTVVEEAHRLLANVARGLDSEVANTRWKAVETFTNILSEVRAYGEGFIVAEQIPTKLSPDVIKNTSLKIMHRTVSEEDRKAVGGSMNLDDQKSKRVASLPVGEAVVFGEGDDMPFRLKPPYVKIMAESKNQDDKLIVKEKMSYFRSDLPEVYVGFDSCVAYCKAQCKYKNIGGKIADDSVFEEIAARFILTMVEASKNPSIILTEYEELKSRMKELWRNVSDVQGVALCAMIQAGDRYFEKRGGQYQWPYDDVANVKSRFVHLVHTLMTNDEDLVGREIPDEEADRAITQEFNPSLRALQKDYLSLTENRQPYGELCSAICEDGTCLYRFANKELLGESGLWDESLAEEDLVPLCRRSAQRVVSASLGPESGQRAALCFGLHMSMEMWPHERRQRVDFVQKILNGLSQNNSSE